VENRGQRLQTQDTRLRTGYQVIRLSGYQRIRGSGYWKLGEQEIRRTGEQDDGEFTIEDLRLLHRSPLRGKLLAMT
jgi:hypothetical protein